MAGALVEALDPVMFARNRLDFECDPWQEKFLRSTAAEIAVNCCRQSGKSTTAAIKALHVAVHRPRSTSLVISPTQRQSGQLLKKARHFLGMLTDQPDLTADSATNMELANGSVIVSLPGTDGGSIRGYTPDLVIEDESAFVSDAVHDAITPMLIVSRGQLILLSTPQGRAGHFFEACCSDDYGFERFVVTANDCPRIDRLRLERERRRKPSRYSREYMCAFLESDTQFFTYDEIEALFDTELRPLWPELNAEMDDAL